MQRYSLMIVCLLSLVAGGAAALALHYDGRGATDIQGVAEAGTDAAGDAGAVTSGGALEEHRLGRESVDSARRIEVVSDETQHASSDAADQAEDDIGMTAGKAGKPMTGVRRRGETNGRSGRGSKPARGYVRNTRGEVAAGGPGLASHTVGGLKKTGKTIGNTFGKIGGVFHD